MKSFLVATLLVMLTACAQTPPTVHVPGPTEIPAQVLGFDCSPGEVRVRYHVYRDPFYRVHEISVLDGRQDRCVPNPKKFELASGEWVRLEVTEERQWSVYSVEKPQ